MGYCMCSFETNFTIKEKNCENALRAIKESYNNSNQPKWLTEKLPALSSLAEALNLLDWEASTLENGDVEIIYFSDSYISMSGDDNNFWQWSFDGRKMVEKIGRLIFE